MRILCFGKSGLVSSALQKWIPELNPEHAVFLSRLECDITNSSQVVHAIESYKPTHVINAAALTNVDDCERIVNDCNLVNGFSVEAMARACEDRGIILIHFSTDYVFNGKKDTPYEEDDITNPINAYGVSKRLSEELIQKICLNHYILRIQWVYGHGHPNFVDTIIQKAQEVDELKIINDQFGSPTSADVVAKAVVNLITNNPVYGVYHFRTLQHTSWYDFATYFLNLCGIKTPVIPVPSETYKTAAKRPKNCIMNIGKWIYNDLYTPPTWKVAVKDYLNKQAKETE
jgi:dTDP-4-dehydrorhamnose reductase